MSTGTLNSKYQTMLMKRHSIVAVVMKYTKSYVSKQTDTLRTSLSPEAYSLLWVKIPQSHQRCVRGPEYDQKLLNFFVEQERRDEEMKNVFAEAGKCFAEMRNLL